MRPVVRSAFALPLILCVLAVLVSPVTGQERPLPDQQSFMAEARKRLQPDEMRQSGYVYLETRRELKLDARGKTTKEEVSVFESYPALPNEFRWQRLIKKNGVPVSQAELDKQDRERQKKVMAWVKKREQNPAKAAAEQAKKGAEERREVERAIEDALLVYDFTMLGRESIGGHDTIVFSFTPKKKPGRPRTREGKIMQKFAGKAWVSESEYELVRLEAEAQETVSFGLGLFARVHKGSKAAFERRKVNGEEWLPASATYTASARVALVKVMRVGGISEYSDYRRFTVGTETVVKTPPQ
jgi:hypothetical protein